MTLDFVEMEVKAAKRGGGGHLDVAGLVAGLRLDVRHGLVHMHSCLGGIATVAPWPCMQKRG